MRNKYKVFLNILLSFGLYFFCVSSVSAFNFNENTDDVFKTCNADNNCVPVCVYGDVGKSDMAMIGYYYDYDAPEFDTDHIGWEISFFNGEQVYEKQNRDDFTADLRKVYYVRDKLLPVSKIYFADGGKDQIQWDNNAAYENLKNKFECPKFFYSDKGNNEMCFSNQIGACPKINSLGTKFSDDNYFALRYEFTQELSYVLHDTYINSHFDDLNTLTDSELKIKFIKSLDSKFSSSYRDDLTEEENVLNYCETFAEEINSDSGETYTNRLMTNLGSSSYFSNLNSKLQMSTTNPSYSSYIKNSNIYDYDILSKILTYDVTENSKKYKNVDFERIDTELLTDNFGSSYKYIETICKQKKNVEISYDKKVISSTIDELYDKWTYKDPKVDITTTYDCSILSDFADVIGTGYFILEMVGLAILIIFSALDYVKIFLNDNADELKKANSKLIKRLIILVVLFLLPALVNTILNIFNIEGFNSSDPLCREVINISNK